MKAVSSRTRKGPSPRPARGMRGIVAEAQCPSRAQAANAAPAQTSKEDYLWTRALSLGLSSLVRGGPAGQQRNPALLQNCKSILDKIETSRDRASPGHRSAAAGGPDFPDFVRG